MKYWLLNIKFAWITTEKSNYHFDKTAYNKFRKYITNFCLHI